MERAYKVIENDYIELSDGVKLSIRLWLPEDAHENPVPAILEFLPYRKRDSTTFRDEINYQHFAKNGYGGVRVDMRGAGDSTGLPQDEYVQQEQDDALEVIDWISKQPWCTGSVGMMGISWGGFNSLQVAACQPPALKAIISIAFTDDRYNDDIHYKGGVMLMANTEWAAYMEAILSLPPDPLISSDWEEKWVERLNNMPPFAELWMSHQTRDAYWKHASVCENYDKIKAATFLISGYADGYTNTVKRTLDNIQCPKRAIVGPWIHLYPNIASPGPKWGFCTEAVKWWDRHLKGLDIPDQPELITYIQENVPIPLPKDVDGRWVQNPTSEVVCYQFGEDRKLGKDSGESIVEFDTEKTSWHQFTGFFFVSVDDLPKEQSADDDRSCMFETEPFTEKMEFLGYPDVTLSVASSKSFANVFLRLCLVDPDGQSRLIAYTACNLNHDEAHETVTALESGVFKTTRARMDFIGESVQAGYKLRLCLAGNNFPTFMPNPEPTVFSLDLSKCKLEMPLLASYQDLNEEVPPVTDCKPMEYVMRTPASYKEEPNVDESGCYSMYSRSYSGEKEFKAHGLISDRTIETTTSMTPNDPASARQDVVQIFNWRRGDEYKMNIRYDLQLTMDKDNYYLEESKKATFNGEVVFNQDKRKATISRNG